MSRPLRGEVRVPGDKSISHRALLFSAMARGRSVIENLSDGEDVRSTWRCLSDLGVGVISAAGRVSVEGPGWRGLRQPKGELDCGNSGTTMRMLMGVLAGNAVEARLTGDQSLRRRPMERVAEPLRRMGAAIETTSGTAPLRVRGAALSGIDYVSPVASAQVKSAVLLAGLLATGTTSVTEPALSRDHTERLLPLFGVVPRREGLKVTVAGGAPMDGARVVVPGDPSSAAFWAVAAAIVPESRLTIRGVGLNPTRTGFLDVLKAMGAAVRVTPAEGCGEEPVGDVTVEAAPLKAAVVEAREAPRLIDEAPILALAASQAEGESRFRGLSELRHKESDRLSGIARLLTALGGDAEVSGDDLIVRGRAALRGAQVDAQSDHRIAMTAMVAGLIAASPVRVTDADCARISYPGFAGQLESLRA